MANFWYTQSGIYKLCIANYYYIGSSNNIQRRIAKHLQHLRENRHVNPFLQNVFNKYPTAHWFEVLEESKKDLLSVEQKYLDLHYGKEGCVNLNPTANKPPSPLGKKWSEASKLKMSQSKIGWKPTDETRHNMSIAARKRCSDPSIIENMKLGFRNRAGKRKPFYLIHNNTKQGPFYSTKECVEKTKCTISACSVYNLCSGRFKVTRGYSIELVE